MLKRLKNRGPPASRNNTAFVLMHVGQTQEAKELLLAEIKQQGASAYELANLAGCFAAEQQFDLADEYIRASAFLTDPDKDTVLLNRALIHYFKRELDLASQVFKRWAEQHPKSLQRYEPHSNLIAELKRVSASDASAKA